MEALEGLGRIHTGDTSIAGAGRWGRIERDIGEASGKPGIQLSRGFHEYGELPNHYIRAVRQLDLLHEIGHHVEHRAGALGQARFAAGEARAENFAYAHAAGNKGREGFSDYDAQTSPSSQPSSELRRRWGARMVNRYKTERAAGSLPGDSMVPAGAAHDFEPHAFGHVSQWTPPENPRPAEPDEETSGGGDHAPGTP